MWFPALVCRAMKSERWEHAPTATQSSVRCLFKMDWVCRLFKFKTALPSVLSKKPPKCEVDGVNSSGDMWGKRVDKNTDFSFHRLIKSLKKKTFFKSEFILWAFLLLNLKPCIGSVWEGQAWKKEGASWELGGYILIKTLFEPVFAGWLPHEAIRLLCTLM